MKLSEIVIPVSLETSIPSPTKLNNAMKYYLKNGKIDKPIVINQYNVLIDGYIRYLVLKMAGIDKTNEVKVIVDRKELKVTTYIYGKHPNQQSDKEYVWRVPTSEKWNMFMENVSVGDIIMCYTKYGVKPVIISRIVRSDFRPMDIPENMKIKRIAKNQRL